MSVPTIRHRRLDKETTYEHLQLGRADPKGSPSSS